MAKTDKSKAAKAGASKTKKQGVSNARQPRAEDPQAAALAEAYLHNRKYALAKDEYSATARDNFNSLALAVRDRLTSGDAEVSSLGQSRNGGRDYRELKPHGGRRSRMSELREGRSQFDAANRLCLFVLSELPVVTEEAITRRRRAGAKIAVVWEAREKGR